MNKSTKTENRSYKVGFSKGLPRVWIDGAVLPQYGFAPQTHYAKDLKPGKIVLTVDPESKRVVTGRDSNAKPIIDLRAQDMFDFIGEDRRAELEAGTLRVDVTFAQDKITIKLL